jgi:hypothetical protein
MAGNTKRKLVSTGKKNLVPPCDERVICGGDYVKKLWDSSADNSEIFLLKVLIKN